jgi:hypothetical protein
MALFSWRTCMVLSAWLHRCASDLTFVVSNGGTTGDVSRNVSRNTLNLSVFRPVLSGSTLACVCQGGKPGFWQLCLRHALVHKPAPVN